MSTTVSDPQQALYEKHKTTLEEAINAVHSREFYAKYPEPPSKRIYGETANEEGLNAFKAQWGNQYTGLKQNSSGWLNGEEESPYTLESLGIAYPYQDDPQSYIDLANQAWPAWKKLDPQTRAGILVESLEKVKAKFFELAYATMHTTGQAFVMSFQASGPHSNDRSLEAIALGLHELTRFPSEVDWKKPMGKFDVELKKYYKMVPKGISLAIGCSTFPVWNTFPGVYASLITGNPAICKPHPKSIYPMAIVVQAIQESLEENGLDPHLVQLAPDTPSNPITKVLAENPAVKIIDYTGGNTFGDYIENLPGKRTFTEKAGVNSIVIESCADLKGMVQNIGFSLSLYSGQMCTAPQNIFIPKSGINAGGEQLSYDQVVEALANSVKGLVTHEKMGPGTLGAIQNPATSQRVSDSNNMGLKVILPSQEVTNPEFPKARIATPNLIEVPADKREVLSKEMFGPIAFIIPVDSWEQGVEIAKELATNEGAITFAAYSVNEDVRMKMVDEMADTFTSVSFNFVGPIWVNQSAGFSDFHVTGGNPAGNASLTDPEYVLGRFEIVGIRIHP